MRSSKILISKEVSEPCVLYTRFRLAANSALIVKHVGRSDQFDNLNTFLVMNLYYISYEIFAKI